MPIALVNPQAAKDPKLRRRGGRAVPTPQAYAFQEHSHTTPKNSVLFPAIQCSRRSRFPVNLRPRIARRTLLIPDWTQRARFGRHLAAGIFRLSGLVFLPPLQDTSEGSPKRSQPQPVRANQKRSTPANRQVS